MVIEENVNQPANSIHEVVPEWRPFCTRWAGAANQFGREYQAAMSTQGVVSAVFEIPYDSETVQITPKHRVRIGTRILNITSAFDFDERHEKIVLGCSEAKPTTAE